MINRILNHQTSKIETSALILAIFTFIGSFLSVFRNGLLASTFGASRLVDMYYASFRIPDFIFNIFILGALAAGFIPLFVKYSNIGKKEANEFGTSIMIGISFFSALLGIIFVIFANPIVKLLFPGFASNDLQTIANLSRIMMIQPIFLGLSSLIGNILQVNNLYVPIAIAPLLYNLGIITGIVFFYPIFGLYGLAYGVILGAFLNLVIKYWPFRKVDFMFSLPHSIIFKKYIKEFVSLTLFRALSIINLQLYLFVISNIASYLKAGSLGIITFASNIQDFPRSVFAMSFAVAAFPVLSRQFAENKKEEFSLTYQKTFVQILSFIIPIFVAFLVFREPIVRLLLGYGKFD
jgi:putative peptidoglycan lipid II flippase